MQPVTEKRMVLLFAAFDPSATLLALRDDKIFRSRKTK